MTSAHKPATYETLLGLPEDVKAEVIAGVVWERLASSPRHAKAQGALRAFVGGPFDDDDGFAFRRNRAADRATLSAEVDARDYGTSTSFPVVFPDSISRCALAASASG